MNYYKVTYKIEGKKYWRVILSSDKEAAKINAKASCWIPKDQVTVLNVKEVSCPDRVEDLLSNEADLLY